MQKSTFRELEKLYDNYRDLLKAQKKLRHKSVLISSLEIKNNVRFRALSDAAVPSVKIPFDVVSELVENGFIRETSEPSMYTITAKGIMEVETKAKTLEMDEIVSHLDAKFFDVFGQAGDLNEKDKVVILSLIAARAFSDASPVDLYKEDTVNGWTGIVEKTYDKLQEMGIVTKLQRGDLFGGSASERPISNLIRHTDTLPRKTKGLYVAAGRQRYYLGVYEDGILSRQKLSYLIRLVFPSGLDAATVFELHEFCRRIAHDDGLAVFDIGSHIFADPRYDEDVLAALQDAAIHA